MDGIIKTLQIKEDYTKIMNETAQDLSISNGARGLLLYVISLPSDFKLKKTVLYNRFKKDADSEEKTEGRRVIDRYLKELEKAGYFLEVPFRLGKENKPCYFMSAMKLTNKLVEECYEVAKESMIKSAQEQNQNLWGVQFEHLNWDVQNEQFKMGCSKRTLIKLNIKQIKSLKTKHVEDDKLDLHQMLAITEKMKEQFNDRLSEVEIKDLNELVISKYFKEEIAADKFEEYLRACYSNTYKQNLEKEQQPKEKKTRRRTNKPVRTEIVPDWLGSGQVDANVSEGDENDVEAQRKKLQEKISRFKKDK